MKKQILLPIHIILGFIFVATSLHADWKKIETIPEPFASNYWLEVFFLDSDTDYGWACGYNGMVIRTSDGGQTWAGVQIPTAGQLESIMFTSKSTGYVSGLGNDNSLRNGVIYKSTDGGATWEDVSNAFMRVNFVSLWGHYFTDDNNGYVIGGGCQGDKYIFKTTDGGNSWGAYPLGEVYTGLTDPLAYRGDMYASTSGYVWRSTDDGLSWDIFSITGPEYWQEDIQMNGNTILVPTSGGCMGGSEQQSSGMRISTDFGASWSEFITGQPMFGAFLLSPLQGWVCGFNESIYYTSDGGKTWDLRNCGVEDVSLDDMWFIDDTTGWVVGEGVYKTHTYEKIKPQLVSDGKLILCSGDNLVLAPDRDYKYYEWSTGEKSKSIVVTKTGKYWLRANNVKCDTVFSDTIDVKITPPMQLTLEIDGPADFCEGEERRITANSGFASYTWADGSTGREIAAKAGGIYSVMAVDSFGCEYTKEIELRAHPNPEPEITLIGDPYLCVTDTLKLILGKEYADYEWYEENSGSEPISGDKFLEILESGRFYVVVRTEFGCEGVSQVMDIEVVPDSNRFEPLIGAEEILSFDSSSFNSFKCKTLTIRNRSLGDFAIEDVFIYRNVEFSSPQSQYPIIIPALDSVELEICYFPSALGIQRDTIIITDRCSDHEIPLMAIGAENNYGGDNRCETPLRISSIDLNSNKFFLSGQPYPNPAASSIEVNFTRFDKNGSPRALRGILYNSLGHPASRPEIVITGAHEAEGGIHISGKMKFNVENLSPGAYIIILEDGFSTDIYPVIVE